MLAERLTLSESDRERGDSNEKMASYAILHVYDHRARTSDLPFQKHAQVGLRVHRFVIQRRLQCLCSNRRNGSPRDSDAANGTLPDRLFKSLRRIIEATRRISVGHLNFGAVRQFTDAQHIVGQLATTAQSARLTALFQTSWDVKAELTVKNAVD